MKIVVIGGSGLIGAKVVDRLRRKGQEAVAASPSTGVNTVTGEGLAAALVGAQIVVDVANSPSFEDKPALDFFETAGRNLLAAEATAGVGHHVALSVVGTDHLLESGYFRAKMAQEGLIRASPIPFTIVRATQFFEFLGTLAQIGTVGQTVHLSSIPMQPIAADDVADALADIALEPPANGILEIGGPERVGLNEIVGRFLAATHDPRVVVTEGHTRYFGLDLSGMPLVPGGGARLGATRFEDWVSHSLSHV